VEYWSIEVLELSHHSITPLLHYSITPLLHSKVAIMDFGKAERENTQIQLDNPLSITYQYLREKNESNVVVKTTA
jgi:hypothetical protein